jgi:hypothetical protein
LWPESVTGTSVALRRRHRATLRDTGELCRRATLRHVNVQLFFVAMLVSANANAIARVVIESAQVVVAGTLEAQRLHAELSLGSSDELALHATAAQLQLASGTTTLKGLALNCRRFDWGAAHYRCRDGQVSTVLHSTKTIAKVPGLKAVNATLDASYDAATGRLEISSDRLSFAGGVWKLSGHWQPQAWQLSTSSPDTDVANWINWLQPFWQPPADLGISGRVAVNINADGQQSQLHAAAVRANFSALNLQNTDGTVATEKVAVLVEASLSGDIAAPLGTVRISSRSGQALLGPVYLDLAAQPLMVSAEVRVQNTLLLIPSFELNQRALLQATGTAEIAREPTAHLQRADIKLSHVQFPAAFASYFQLALATTNFGALETRGDASAQLTVRNGALTRVDAMLDGLDLDDRARELQILGMRGPIHWASSDELAPIVSALSWQQLRVASLEGGSSELQLLAHGTALTLASPARIAIFDGALAVQRFESAQLGSDAVSLGFDATIEPISMQKLSVAFGWPPMAGTLSGRIPGLAFESGVLSVAGDIVASVFDGQVTVSKLQLRNLLSRFPRLTAEVAARRLDLEQITRTFPVGTITGRLDTDVRGLELFDWSPIAFDAELYTTNGDKTRHRISQKAVDSITRLGGGRGLGGALQNGFLRFFDDFGYERIGLRCQLRNDVCLMSGIDKGGGTYYMVKGGGIPRIDVVGNAGRVAWTQLVSQISAALVANDLVVK